LRNDHEKQKASFPMDYNCILQKCQPPNPRSQPVPPPLRSGGAAQAARHLAIVLAHAFSDWMPEVLFSRA